MNWIKKLFWKVYRVEFVTTDKKNIKISFFKGLKWDVVKSAHKIAKEKGNEDNLEWTVYQITEI